MQPLFTRKLLEWNRKDNIRPMPWKGEKDPYRIWLSEIILQQTRVEQGLAYYNRFIEAFPDVKALANAPQEKVFKLWEGLGYYSRCKNLIATAAYIANELDGKFPETYQEILALKGIGPYTASAIASFAYNLPHAVVDGNVLRVLSRYMGITTSIQSNAGRKQFDLLAASLLDKTNAAIYNQAMMDFGATVCKPRQPLCPICIQRNECKALGLGIVNQLPVKEKKAERKKRWLNYLVIRSDDHLLVRKRPSGDIWENLYEFYLRESSGPLENTEIYRWVSETGSELLISDISLPILQQLTHQTITSQFVTVSAPGNYPMPEGYIRVLEEEISSYAFPKIISRFLERDLKQTLL